MTQIRFLFFLSMLSLENFKLSWKSWKKYTLSAHRPFPSIYKLLPVCYICFSFLTVHFFLSHFKISCKHQNAPILNILASPLPNKVILLHNHPTYLRKLTLSLLNKSSYSIFSIAPQISFLLSFLVSNPDPLFEQYIWWRLIKLFYFGATHVCLLFFMTLKI